MRERRRRQAGSSRRNIHQIFQVSSHLVVDRTSVALGEAHQDISLSREAFARLRRAPEAFLVLDLEIPDGNPRGVRVSLNGRAFPPRPSVPTMPRFGESTAAGGRNRREYRQWWAIRLTPDDLPKSAPRSETSSSASFIPPSSTASIPSITSPSSFDIAAKSRGEPSTGCPDRDTLARGSENDQSARSSQRNQTLTHACRKLTTHRCEASPTHFARRSPLRRCPERLVGVVAPRKYACRTKKLASL